MNLFIYFLSFFKKDIPMETLDPAAPHEIRLLYYISPSRFYVYRREKLSPHASVNKKTFLLNLNAIYIFH